MQTQKMSLASIQGKLSRAEMKNIMAGMAISESCNCNSSDSCGKDAPCCVSGCSGGNGYAGVCHTECA